jgi:4,5-dihydroxyphthalate decarboxylase
VGDLHLTLACGPYDRTLALQDGSLKPDGIELTYVPLQPAEIFWRQLQYREFDVSELSISNYVTLQDAGDNPFVAIPVFPSRAFRHGYIFINTNCGIQQPSDLVGKRGGVPEYSQTAALYIRGMLQHEYGVRPEQIRWTQNRTDRIERPLPQNIQIERAPGQELGDLLERGELDFLITGNNPLSFRRGSPNVARLFPDYKAAEQDYYRRTSIYPIMHCIAIRRDLHEQYPWVALNLYHAFFEAKERAYRKLLETGSAKATLAWLQAAIEEERLIFGTDWWPYGVEPNRPTLASLVQFVHEQGLSDRQVPVEELFAPSTLKEIPLGEGQHIL